MQLSAANLLIAAQQAARPAPQAGAPKFAAALAAENTKDDAFAPLAFRQTAGAAPARPATVQNPPSRPGAALDIRV